MDTSNTNRVKGRTIGKSTGAATSRLRALRRMLAAVFAPRARWRPRGPGSRSLVGRILAINMITLLIPVIGFLYTDRYRQLLIEGELEAYVQRWQAAHSRAEALRTLCVQDAQRVDKARDLGEQREIEDAFQARLHRSAAA